MSSPRWRTRTAASASATTSPTGRRGSSTSAYFDTETEGIILLTNHGELAHRLTHPKYGVKKTYLAAIQGPLPRDLGKHLKDGIQLEDGYARADHFRVVENTGKNYLVEVTLHEGRKHIVRRMLAE